MKHNSLHLLFKFHEEGTGEFAGIRTMEEHIKVMEEKGKVIWGHFSKNHSLKGLWDVKVDIIKKQIGAGSEAFVFFCDNENKLLYVSKYLNSYKRNEVERTIPLTQYIPAYYHHKVGTPSMRIEGEMRSYAYAEVTKIVKIPFDRANFIYTYDDGDTGVEQRVLENRGMSSKFYVRLDADFYDELKTLTKVDDGQLLNASDITILEDEDYQKEVENIIPDDAEDVTIVDQAKEKPQRTEGNRGSTYKRDVKAAKTSIVAARYCCEINAEHKDFTSSVTGENYVEAHHLIPMEYQDNHELDFKSSLDVEANIVSLCVGCHKKFHHAVFEEKKEIIKQLYNQRKERLEKCNIKIGLNDLYKCYK